MRRALDDLLSAKDTLQGKKKKSHKGRNMVLLAGVIAGALYNPWTGPQTREKLLDMIAGQDDLQPLETFETTGRAGTAGQDRGGGRRGRGDRRERRQVDQVEGQGRLVGEPTDSRWSGPRRRRAPAAARRHEPARARDVARVEEHGARAGRRDRQPAARRGDVRRPEANETSSARRQAMRNG